MVGDYFSLTDGAGNHPQAWRAESGVIVPLGWGQADVRPDSG
jgi:hypothetical protein